MAPLRGWGPHGQRLIAKPPMAAGARSPSWPPCRVDRIDAPCLFDGPINGQKFLAYIKQFLIPTLRTSDVVILDNLGSHKGKAVRRAIREAGAKLLFLPPYSPDLNPIEQAFAKLKHWLRQAQARSIGETYRSLAPVLERFQPKECAAYLANAGYASA